MSETYGEALSRLEKERPDLSEKERSNLAIKAATHQNHNPDEVLEGQQAFDGIELPKITKEDTINPLFHEEDPTASTVPTDGEITPEYIDELRKLYRKQRKIITHLLFGDDVHVWSVKDAVERSNRYNNGEFDYGSVKFVPSPQLEPGKFTIKYSGYETYCVEDI